MSADRYTHTHTHTHQLMSYELVYTSIHSSIIIILYYRQLSRGYLVNGYFAVYTIVRQVTEVYIIISIMIYNNGNLFTVAFV